MALIALRRASSTDFWSAERASGRAFFCSARETYVSIKFPTHPTTQIQAPPIRQLLLEGVYPYLGWLASFIESILVTLLLRLLLGEVGVVELAHINTRDIDLGRGSNDVSSVDSADWNTIDLERTGNEEDTLVEVLQQNDALSTVSTSEDDKNGTRLEGWAEGSWPSGLAGLVVWKKCQN